MYGRRESARLNHRNIGKTTGKGVPTGIMYLEEGLKKEKGPAVIE